MRLNYPSADLSLKQAVGELYRKRPPVAPGLSRFLRDFKGNSLMATPMGMLSAALVGAPRSPENRTLRFPRPLRLWRRKLLRGVVQSIGAGRVNGDPRGMFNDAVVAGPPSPEFPLPAIVMTNAFNRWPALSVEEL